MLEARQVLLNHVTIDSNDRFVTVDEFRFQLWGAADGEASLRFWGLAKRKFIFKSNLSNTQAVFKVNRRITTLGRGINFKSNDKAAGCIVRTYVFYPVVLAFYENEEGELELAAFTPKWLTAGLAISVVVRKFEKIMDGLVERVETEDKTLSEKIHSYFADKKEERQNRIEKNKKLRQQSQKKRKTETKLKKTRGLVKNETEDSIEEKKKLKSQKKTEKAIKQEKERNNSKKKLKLDNMEGYELYSTENSDIEEEEAAEAEALNEILSVDWGDDE